MPPTLQPTHPPPPLPRLPRVFTPHRGVLHQGQGEQEVLPIVTAPLAVAVVVGTPPEGLEPTHGAFWTAAVAPVVVVAAAAAVAGGCPLPPLPCLPAFLRGGGRWPPGVKTAAAAAAMGVCQGACASPPHTFSACPLWLRMRRTARGMPPPPPPPLPVAHKKVGVGGAVGAAACAHGQLTTQIW